MARITVHEGWVAVVRRDARVLAVLGAGRHRLPRPAWRRRVDVVDQRLALLLVTGQEVATADVPGAKVSVLARWRVADRAAATGPLTASVRAAVADVGIEVEEVAVRDVVVPGELRRAVLALATARQEGQVALERARSETAALRALANGARVLADYPDLARLRLAQAAGEAGGTVVIEVGRSTS